jgi:hypothetical protein
MPIRTDRVRHKHAEMQGGFLRALLSRDSEPPAGLIRASRFQVHRNNLLSGLTGVLRAHFPVVARLVGEDFFVAAARAFIREHPPSTPVLIEYGKDFPSFLEAFEPARGVPYLGDVARLEWLWHAAYHAHDREPLTARCLADVPPEEAAGLAFKFHPSAGLIASRYPVVSIWETNSFDTEVRPIAGHSAEAALVIRPKLEVKLLKLDPAEYAFAAALSKGATLGEAATGASSDDGFNLAHSLARLIAAGVLAGFTGGGKPEGDLVNA